MDFEATQRARRDCRPELKPLPPPTAWASGILPATGIQGCCTSIYDRCTRASPAVEWSNGNESAHASSHRLIVVAHCTGRLTCWICILKADGIALVRRHRSTQAATCTPAPCSLASNLSLPSIRLFYLRYLRYCTHSNTYVDLSHHENFATRPSCVCHIDHVISGADLCWRSVRPSILLTLYQISGEIPALG